MRKSRYGIDKQFLKRFSPITFKTDTIDEEIIKALIEAASTAPSCFNEQPWVFVPGNKNDFISILAEANVIWAKEAAAFMLVCSHTTFSRNQKPNNWHAYDCGTAMGYLILEALKHNIYVHPMAGFDATKAIDIFDLKSLQPHAVLALGYSEETHAMTERKPLEEIILDRRYT